MTTDYDKMREELIHAYRSPPPEILAKMRPEFARLQAQFATAYAEVMVETLRAIEERRNPSTLIEVVTMVSAGALANLIDRLGGSAENKHKAAANALIILSRALNDGADLVETSMDLPERKEH